MIVYKNGQFYLVTELSDTTTKTSVTPTPEVLVKLIHTPDELSSFYHEGRFARFGGKNGITEALEKELIKHLIIENHQQLSSWIKVFIYPELLVQSLNNLPNLITTKEQLNDIMQANPTAASSLITSYLEHLFQTQDNAKIRQGLTMIESLGINLNYSTYDNTKDKALGQCNLAHLPSSLATLLIATYSTTLEKLKASISKSSFYDKSDLISLMSKKWHDIIKTPDDFKAVVTVFNTPNANTDYKWQIARAYLSTSETAFQSLKIIEKSCGLLISNRRLYVHLYDNLPNCLAKDKLKETISITNLASFLANHSYKIEQAKYLHLWVIGNRRNPSEQAAANGDDELELQEMLTALGPHFLKTNFPDQKALDALKQYQPPLKGNELAHIENAVKNAYMPQAQRIIQLADFSKKAALYRAERQLYSSVVKENRTILESITYHVLKFFRPLRMQKLEILLAHEQKLHTEIFNRGSLDQQLFDNMKTAVKKAHLSTIRATVKKEMKAAVSQELARAQPTLNTTPFWSTFVSEATVKSHYGAQLVPLRKAKINEKADNDGEFARIFKQRI